MALLSSALEKPPAGESSEALKGGSASARRLAFHTPEIFPKAQAKLGAD